MFEDARIRWLVVKRPVSPMTSAGVPVFAGVGLFGAGVGVGVDVGVAEVLGDLFTLLPPSWLTGPDCELYMIAAAIINEPSNTTAIIGRSERLPGSAAVPVPSPCPPKGFCDSTPPTGGAFPAADSWSGAPQFLQNLESALFSIPQALQFNDRPVGEGMEKTILFFTRVSCSASLSLRVTPSIRQNL
jgi:hypothetical protein